MHVCIPVQDGKSIFISCINSAHLVVITWTSECIRLLLDLEGKSTVIN